MKIETIITDENAVRVRKTPELNGEILFSIPKDEQVIVSEIKEEWSKVVYNGNTGYILNCFLKETPFETINMSKEELKNLVKQVECLLEIIKRII